MDRSKCKVDWCDNYAVCKGYCDRHYRQVKNKGYIIDNKDVKTKHIDIPCKVDGCNNLSKANGYCDKHYAQMRRNGNISQEKEKFYICIVDNCNSETYINNMCIKHYTQQIRHNKTFNRTLRDKNEFITYEEFTEMIIYDKDNNEKCRVKIDTEKINEINNTKWHIDKHGYIAGYDKGKQIKLHRILMEVDKRVKVDHINRDKLDNRIENLRIVNSSQNSINRGIQSNNKTGVVGVGWNKKSSKWEARIGLNRKNIVLGYFTDFDEAVRVRREAEKVYHGEFSPNHGKDDEICQN